jgi:hypothetical protein
VPRRVRPAMEAHGRTRGTMPLDDAALPVVLEAMQAGGVEDRVGRATQRIYQALIAAELTRVIGASPWERSPERTGEGVEYWLPPHRPLCLTGALGVR